MNKYESVVIINPNLDEAGLKALEDKFTGLINEKGKVSEVVNLGKKKLSYEIHKHKEAHYIVFKFEAAPEHVAELERVYRITDEVLKYLTTKIKE